MLMYISIYCNAHPNQNLFKTTMDPKYCVKAIKEYDNYLHYIAYAEYCHITKARHNIYDVLSGLLLNNKSRIEAYLKLWSLLMNDKTKDLKKAFQLSEKYYNMASSIKFDDNIY